MLFRNYHKIKLLQEKQEKHLERLNQTICIRDLIVYPTSSNFRFAYGEAREHDNVYIKQESLLRLIDQVEVLASIANTYHEQYYCDKTVEGKYLINDSCLNKITRLSLHEFSLFTNQPLNLSDFSVFIEAVESIAIKQLPNVHLLLSSISVLNTKNQIVNISFYVQCGAEPIIQSITKGRYTISDCLVYYNPSIFSQQEYPEKIISSYIGLEDANPISSNSVFSIKTLGKAEYIQVVEICIDHQLRHAQTIMEQLIESASTYIPNQVDHIVTANSLEIENEECFVANSILQVDPDESIKSHISNDLVEEINVSLEMKEKYQAMLISKNANGVSIKNPPFGSSFCVVTQDERKLESFSENASKLKTKVSVKNHEIFENNINIYHKTSNDQNKMMIVYRSN